MKQFKADHKLYALVKKEQSLAFASCIAMMMFVFFPVLYAVLQADIPEFSSFWLFETGLMICFVFTFRSVYKKAEVLGRTINNLTFDAQTVTIKTFGFTVLGLSLVKPRIVRTECKEVLSFKSVFPIKDNSFFDQSICLVIKVKEGVFYFKEDCFEKQALQILTQN